MVSDVVRFTIAPGINIPFGGANFATQAGNLTSAFTAENPDIQVLGYGGRVWLDYIFNKSLFIDLYSQFIDYPGTVALKDSSLSGYLYYNATASNPDVNYGYTLRFELDPHYNFDVAEGINLAFNCAFRYDGTPATTWSTPSLAPSILSSGPATTLWNANPSIDIFFYKSPLPFEVDLDYGQPLFGTNANAAYSLDIQIKAYLKFW
ncbi:MAG: hypothetical protein ABSF43_08880 [Rectinemataceae bacterium]